MSAAKKIAVVTIIVGIAIALGYSQMMGYGYGWISLNLSDQQWEEIEKLRLDHQKEMINLRSELDRAYLELDKLYQLNDEKKIDKQLERINRIKTRMDKEIVKFRTQVRSKLNPEQQKIFDSSGYGNECYDHYGMGYGRHGYGKHPYGGRYSSYGCGRYWY